MLIIALVLVIVLIVSGYYALREEAEEQRHVEEEKEEREQQYKLNEARSQARYEFGVDVKPPYKSQAYDEIVRIVNLLAQLTAKACVAQDKFVRSEKIDEIDHNTTWDDEVNSRKRKWSQKRNLALRVCPELASRLPHFSEFEPLKSYREDHLREKADKKSAA